jgi:regulator of RNase E activity RraA
MAPEIRQLVPGVRVLGRAFTVKCPIGDWSAGARAVDEAGEGDVLVIDAGGTPRTVGWGGTCAAFAQQKGVRGCVTNGAARDLQENIDLAFPVYATGTSVRAGVRTGKGETQVPVSVGGVIVMPGDVIVGDVDGIVVVPASMEDEVGARIPALLAREARMKSEIATAKSYAELTRK